MPLVRKDPQGVSPNLQSFDNALALRSVSKSERWAAARAMASAEHVAALGAALIVEQDMGVREAILTSLTRIGTLESAASTLPCLRSDDAQVRTGALDALRAMPQVAAPLLPGLLRDDDADVRLLSCEIVRMLPAAAATKLLADLLERESDGNGCASDVEVLAEIGDAAALPALESAAARFKSEPFLQFSIDAAIARIESTSDGPRD